jgi:hypothetical protein
MNEQVKSALSSLKGSAFRSRFKLSAKDRSYLREKGIDVIRKHATDLITTRISPAFPKNDGKQTPMKNHPVFVAQHATATCCRGCLLKWHRIPKGRVLREPEISYIVDLIMVWINHHAQEGA